MPDRTKRCGGGAFTLIELLIVVAIIAILAAIAVPNFLEAQTRARVSRVKADLRTVKTGLESYFVDNNAFPHLLRSAGADQDNRGGIHHVVGLTTPIAYLQSVDLGDPFAPIGDRDSSGNLIGHPDPWGTPYSLAYVNILKYWADAGGKRPFSQPAYVVLSLGPDYKRGPTATPGYGADWAFGNYAKDPVREKYYPLQQYEASNGTRSNGDILMWP